MRRIVSFGKLSHQIVFSILAVSLPMALAALYFLVHGINNDIAVAETEIHGDAYQRPLEALLEDLPAFGRAVLQKVSASDLESKIARDWQDLTAVNALYGTELQFT